MGTYQLFTDAAADLSNCILSEIPSVEKPIADHYTYFLDTKNDTKLQYDREYPAVGII